MGKVVQTDKPNVYLKSYVREKQPFIGNTEILYFGTESEGFKRFQANFEDSK